MIREIEPKDNQQMGEIVQSALEEEGLNLPGTAYYDPFLFRLSEHYQEQEGKYWVIEEEGKVIGGAGIGRFGQREDLCELQKLYIDKKTRGKGYSRLLMEKALDYAKAHYSACYIETFDALKSANVLYEKYGFKRLSHPFPESEHTACDAWFLKEF